MQVVDDVRTSPDLRSKFYTLTNTVFGFDLRLWHELGYWPDKYQPHAFIDGDVMISNVSTFEMRLLLEGKEYNARQIGTVMTHPDHRGKGYASQLMQHVVGRYENETEAFFLFTSESLIEYYEQFGFVAVPESRFLADVPMTASSGAKLSKLDLNQPDVKRFLFERVRSRVPVSRRFGIVDGAEIFMYHCLYRYADHIYHDEVQDCVLIARQVDDVLHFYDIVSTQQVDVAALASAFAGEGVREVEFHFTPDQLSIPVRTAPFDPDDIFMVRSQHSLFTEHFRNQETMQA